MSRKRKRGRKRPPHENKKHTPLSLDALQDRAQAELRAGRFRTAIASFKELLKQEQRPAWVTALGEAYSGRAKGLADKGLFKEAIVLWENRAAACQQPLVHPFYFRLLFAAGRVEQAVALFRDQKGYLEAQGWLAELRVQFAAQALAGYTAAIQGLPPDESVVTDYPAAVAALRAYADGDDTTLETMLKRIPFRSPYRDFRQIFKALVTFDNAPASAVRLLEHIPPKSPFACLADAVMAATQSGAALFQSLRAHDKETCHFVTVLRGWSEPKQFSLLQELMQLGEKSAPERLMRFLLRNAGALGEDYVKGIAMKLLIPYPEGRRSYSKSFAELTPFDLYRIAALAEEHDEEPDLFRLYDLWMEAVGELDKMGAGQGTDDGLRTALILRHVAEECLSFDPLQDEAMEALERSLKYDPDDLPTYLRLIAHYRLAGAANEARRVLKQALTRYPEDIEILTAAVETAVAGQAFKKAAGYARRILEIDPINSKVRGILLESHLSHAGKQIKRRKLELATKEIEQAAQWARGEQATGHIELMRGLLALADGDADAARCHFDRGDERLGGGLVGRFYLLLAAARAEQPMAKILKQAKLSSLSETAEHASVVELVRVINESPDDELETLKAIMEHFATPLRQAVKLPFSETESELICEMLRRLDQAKLRVSYARAALKRWSGHPVFTYHLVDATYDSSFEPLSSKDRMQLQTAYERAREEGDMRSAHRIGELLDRRNPFLPPHRLSPPIPEDNAFGPEFSDLVDVLGIDKVIELIMKSGDAAEVSALEKELGSEGLRLLLETMLRGGTPEDLGGILGGTEGLPSQEGPKPKRSAGRKRPQNKETHPDQFDLF